VVQPRSSGHDALPPAASAGGASGERSRRDWLVVLALAAGLLLPGLGTLDLWAPDEPRYAQVAEEMRSMQHGASGLVLLHLNGEPYTQKPPLYYWLAALTGLPSQRVTELAARLPSALAGIACALLTLGLGRRLFAAPNAALLGAMLLVTVQRYAHLARRAQLDVLLTLFELLSLLAFWRLVQPPSSADGPRWPWLGLLHGATALALMTKGPVGLLPYLVMVLFLAWEGRLRDLRAVFPAWALVLASAPVLAWISSAVALAPAGFFTEAFIDNVLARFFRGTAHVRPFYYYVHQLPLDFLPWTPLLLAAVPTAWRAVRTPHRGQLDENSAWRFLVCWLLTMLLFFSLSSGKRGLYLLPAYPAAALLCGGFLSSRAAGSAAARRWLEWGAASLLLVLCAAGTAVLLAAAPGISVSPGFVLPHRFGGAIAILCAVALAIQVYTARRGQAPMQRMEQLVWTVAAIELAGFLLLYPAFDTEKSPRPIAEAAARITRANDPIGVYGHRALTGGIAYYSDRRVVALESADDLERFIQEGGRAVIVKQRYRSRARPLAMGRIRAESRHGRRRLLLLEVAPILGHDRPG